MLQLFGNNSAFSCPHSQAASVLTRIFPLISLSLPIYLSLPPLFPSPPLSPSPPLPTPPNLPTPPPLTPSPHHFPLSVLLFSPCRTLKDAQHFYQDLVYYLSLSLPPCSLTPPSLPLPLIPTPSPVLSFNPCCSSCTRWQMLSAFTGTFSATTVKAACRTVSFTSHVRSKMAGSVLRHGAMWDTIVFLTSGLGSEVMRKRYAGRKDKDEGSCKPWFTEFQGFSTSKPDNIFTTTFFSVASEKWNIQCHAWPSSEKFCVKWI